MTLDANTTKPWLQYYPEWTAHSLEYGFTTLPGIYDDNLERNADKPATRFFGRSMTYAELDKEVRRAAARATSVSPSQTPRSVSYTHLTLPTICSV